MDSEKNQHKHNAHCNHCQSDGKYEDENMPLDAANSSLYDALKMSFSVLKVIMIVLGILFVFSGVTIVAPNEKALVLRFGKIIGNGENRVLGAGLKFLFPYPIHEVVKVPVQNKVNLAINSFWYYQTPKEIVQKSKKFRPQLLPEIDGYCLTRGEGLLASDSVFGQSDYTIIHTKWQLTYQVNDPERFFCNVYVENTKPGQNYGDVIADSVNPLLTSLFDNAVVNTMVKYTLDEVKFEKIESVSRDVKIHLQKNLDRIGSGIKVISIQMVDSSWPRQVGYAFQELIRVSQESQKQKSVAKAYATEKLNNVAGQVANELYEAIITDNQNVEYMESLWKRLAGEAQSEIGKANAYRTKVVQEAKANSSYFEKILPEYRKNPELVLQEIYRDAIENIFDSVDEKIVIDPGTNNSEIRLILNRDPANKKKPKKHSKH